MGKLIIAFSICITAQVIAWICAIEYMRRRWWNNMVDEQARLESKTDKVKVFKVINGVYVEG